MSLALRLDKVREMLRKRGLDGVVLGQEANVSWLFGGRYHINVVAESACAVVFVSLEGLAALVNNIEAERIKREEGLQVDDVYVYSWYDESKRTTQLQAWLARPSVVLDTDISEELLELRVSLEPDRLEQVRQLGIHLAEALEETCKSARQGQTELEVAACLSSACLSRGIEPIVNLVGNEHRAEQFRHLLPTGQPIQTYGIVSVGGRRDGLVLSATRMFHFGPVPEDLAQRYRAVLRVNGAVLSASRVGATLSTVFQRAVQQYELEGYTDEWTFHHQGGLAGYHSREIRATATSEWQLARYTLVAWNPSIRGVKSEDTALVTESGSEILTRSGDFPMCSVQVGADEVLELPDILVL